MKKFLVIFLILSAAFTLQAGKPSGQKIIRDYCWHLPKDFMLEGMIFHDKDSRHILWSFLDRQQSATSSDTIYIITHTTASYASERVYLIRGDSVLYMKREKTEKGEYVIRASQCKASNYFTDEYLSMLRTMSVYQMPFQYTTSYYDVARLVYANGRLASYDSDHHFVSGCQSSPELQAPLIYIPFPNGKRHWTGRFHPNRVDYPTPPLPDD